MTDHFRFVHITDTHIMAGGAWRMRGTDVDFDTDASLRRVVDTVRRLDPAPAFAVLGGDLTSPDLLHRDRVLEPAEYASSYMRLKEILAGLPCPTLAARSPSRNVAPGASDAVSGGPKNPCYR